QISTTAPDLLRTPSTARRALAFCGQTYCHSGGMGESWVVMLLVDLTRGPLERSALEGVHALELHAQGVEPHTVEAALAGLRAARSLKALRLRSSLRSLCQLGNPTGRLGPRPSTWMKSSRSLIRAAA